MIGAASPLRGSPYLGSPYLGSPYLGTAEDLFEHRRARADRARIRPVHLRRTEKA